jgi:hypothetical protein
MFCEKALSNRSTRLEKICSYRSSARSQKPRHGSGLVALQIDQVEHLALARRQRGKKVADVFRHFLAIHARTRIGCVHVLDIQECSFGQLTPPAVLAVPLKRDPPRYPVHPAFDRRVATVLS